MHPRSMEVTIIWGVLYLAIKAAMSSRRVLAGIVRMLNKFKKGLSRFHRYSKSLNDRSELREALVDMFIALINFWVEAVKFLRSHSVDHMNHGTTVVTLILDAFWPDLTSRFNDALLEMDDAIDNVHELAQDARDGDEAERRKQVDTDMLAMVSIEEEESATKFPIYELPQWASLIYGRQKELETVKNSLSPKNETQAGESRAGTGIIWCCAIYGLGGVGKTTLAQAFAQHARDASLFDAIFWIRSQTTAELRDSFAQIALRLELPRASKDADNDSNVILVKNWLGKTSKKWLLIYDNVDELSLLSKYLPPSAGPIIITTRYDHVALHAPGRCYALELGSLSMEASLELFEGLRTYYHPEAPINEERPETIELLSELGGLALGVEQIAAYVGYRKMTIKAFRDKYNRMTVLVHQDNKRALHSLASVWEMHFENIHGKSAANLLGMMCFLNPGAIPLELFLPGDPAVIEPYASICNDETDIEEAVELLMKVALIKRHGDTLSLHRLVQTAFIHSRYGLNDADRPDRQEALKAVAGLVNYRFPKMGGPLSLHGRWDECSKWFHHTDSMAYHYNKLCKSKLPLKSTAEFDELLKNSTWFQYELGELKDCLRLLDIAYDACLDKDGLIYAYHCNTASCVYFEMNDLVRCREATEKCLRIREAKLEPNHPDFGNCYSNSGCLLLSEGRLDEALDMANRAEQVRLRDGTSGAIYLATNHMETGRIHFFKKQFALAKEYYKRSDDLYKSSGNSECWLHGSLMFAMGNLASTQDNLVEAKERYTQALQVCSKLGPTQILISTLHYKLGITETKCKNTKEAIAHFEKALVIAQYRDANGEIARIYRAKAIAFASAPEATNEQLEEAKTLKFRAELMRMAIEEELQIGRMAEHQTPEEVYDNLVCGYFR